MIEDKPIHDKKYLFRNFFSLIKKSLIAIFLIFLVSSFFSNFFYIDIFNGCFIKLLPSWDFNFNQQKIKKGLVVLKNALPEDYKNVCKRIDTIDPNMDCGKQEGGCYWHGNTKRISVSTADTPVSWVAGVIVHETCHSKQDFEKRPGSEEECYAEDNRVLESLSVY